MSASEEEEKPAPRSTEDKDRYIYSFGRPLEKEDEIISIYALNFNVIRIMRGMAHINYLDPPEKRLKQSAFCHYDIQKERNMYLFYRTKEEEVEFAEFLFDFNEDTFQKVGLSKIARIAELLYRTRFYGEEAQHNIWILGHFADIKRSFELMREKVEIDFPETRMVSEEVWKEVCERKRSSTLKDDKNAGSYI